MLECISVCMHPVKVEDIVFELSMLCRGSRAGKKIIDSTNALSMSDGLEEKEG